MKTKPVRHESQNFATPVRQRYVEEEARPNIFLDTTGLSAGSLSRLATMDAIGKYLRPKTKCDFIEAQV